jgi:sulfotransferase famil protein
MKRKTIIFLHIPKTGGLTLSKIALQNYSPNAIYRIDGSRPQESQEEFRNLPDTRKMEIDFLEGHLSFGIHEYTPKPSTYMTILRDPIDRVISAYYYMLTTHDHPFHERTNEFKSIEEFLESKTFNFINNGQVRLLSDSDNLNYGECPKELVDIALLNLRNHFSFVGLLERFDDYLVSCYKNLDWSYPVYTKVNVTKHRPKKNQISDKARKIIANHNVLDIELYEKCKTIIDKEMDSKTIKFNSFMFKQMNRLYNISSLRYPRLKRVIENISRTF